MCVGLNLYNFFIGDLIMTTVNQYMDGQLTDAAGLEHVPLGN